MTNEIFEQKESKVKSFFAKVGKRNLVVICAVLLISGAIVLNWALFTKADNGKDGYDGYENGTGTGQNNGGSSSSGGGVSDDASSVVDDTDSFFASSQISRERARDEAMEVLQSVIDNESADEATKAAAVADMTKLAQAMESEANIETLILAKGFKKCVAVINDDAASIIVKSEGEITPAQLAQINEIVYSQTGILPLNINVIEK